LNLHKVTWWLVVIGGMNWLLVGLFRKDIVDMLSLGSDVGKVIYLLVGLSARYSLAYSAKTSWTC